MAILPARMVMEIYLVMTTIRSHTVNRGQFKSLLWKNLTTGSGDRKLDDAELDSGDDESRRDRIANTIEDDNDNGDPVEDQVVQIYPSDIGRMAEVEVSNGNVSGQESITEDKELSLCSFMS